MTTNELFNASNVCKYIGKISHFDCFRETFNRSPGHSFRLTTSSNAANAQQVASFPAIGGLPVV